MKFNRGTLLRWTPKALNPRSEGSAQRHVDDRMVVLSHDEVMFVRNGVIEQMDMYKTQDSYVCGAGLVADLMPPRLRVHAEEVRRCSADALVSEFKLIVTSKYEGRRV